jgi:glycerol uptake facilitator protein
MAKGCDGAHDCSEPTETTKQSSAVCDDDPVRSGTVIRRPRLVDLWTKQFARQLLAEFLGTGIIVGLGTGAVMSYIFAGALVGLFQVAAVWIIAVTIAIATAGPISGAHLNPAISVTFAIFRPCGGFGWIKVPPFIVAQLCGAIFFSWMNLIMYGPLIVQFEEDNNIIRGAPDSIASAKAFGEYYL